MKESVINEKKICVSVDLFGYKLFIFLSDKSNIYVMKNF